MRRDPRKASPKIIRAARRLMPFLAYKLEAISNAGSSLSNIASTGVVDRFLVDFQDIAESNIALANGVDEATLTTSSLSVASHSLSAVYGGDDNFVTSTSSTLTQTVNQASTTASLSASANPSVFGQSVTFTATIAASSPGAGTPTGTVTFYDGTTSLGTGTLGLVNGSDVATLMTSSLVLAAHSITAVYGGDTNFTTSTSSALSQTVNQDATSTSISSSVASPIFGQSVTYTVNVAANSPGSGTPTGTITIKDGTTTLWTGSLSGTPGSDQATFTTSSLAAGSHALTAIYGGDTNFSGSTSSAVTQNVGQAATSTSISASPNSPIFGQIVTYTATISVTSPGAGTPTGTVTFMDGTTTLGTGNLTGRSVKKLIRPSCGLLVIKP
jgi:hypothetical protein